MADGARGHAGATPQHHAQARHLHPWSLVTLHLFLRLDELRLLRLSSLRRWLALPSALVTMSELQIGEPERVAVLLQLPQTLDLFDG
ncbi:MAG: hypothetical protein OXI41_03140 [Chloroflexota bacterium]|nr:hypothetical protein [Chloroflexota bacterium]